MIDSTTIRRFVAVAVLLAVVTASFVGAVAASSDRESPPPDGTGDRFHEAGDDRFEDNDGFETATPITPGTYDDLVVTGGDPDYFALDVPAGHEITVTAEFAHANADVDLSLFNLARARFAHSASKTDDEQVHRTVLLPGTYYVLVETDDELSDDGSRGGIAPYRLVVAVEPVPTLELGTHDDLVVSRDDPDYFALNLSAGHEVTVTAESVDADIDIYLFDDGEVAFLSASEARAERFRGPIFGDGTYYLRISSKGDGTTVYNLSVTSAPIPTIEPGTHDAQVLSGDRTAVYALDLAAGETVNVTAVTLAADDTPNTIHVRLYDATGQTVAKSNNPLSGNEETATFEFAVATAGTYYPLVAKIGDSRTLVYRLEVAVVAGDDRFEENDDRFEAAALAPGTHEALSVGPGDPDWYAVDVPDGGALTATVQFAHAEADVDLGLYDAAGVPLAVATSKTDDETVTASSLPAGVYSLRVDSADGGTAAYILTVTVEANATAGGPLAFDAPIPGNPGVPTDPDGDGRFDDVNGDGQVDFADVIALAFVDWASLTPAQTEALDFDGNGRVDFADVIELAFG